MFMFVIQSCFVAGCATVKTEDSLPPPLKIVEDRSGIAAMSHEMNQPSGSKIEVCNMGTFLITQ
jgi:hypothetical protein